MTLAWKRAAKDLRKSLGTARSYWGLWEHMAKGRIDKAALQELDRVRLDAFAGWFSARLLWTSLQYALREGVFTLPVRIQLEKDLAKVNIEDPDQFREGGGA